MLRVGSRSSSGYSFLPLQERVSPEDEVAIPIRSARDTSHLAPQKLADLNQRVLNLFKPDPPAPPGTYLPRDFLNRQDLVLMQLSERTVTDSIGRILAGAEPKEGHLSVIDPKTWDDLALVSGTQNNPQANVADAIARTRTIAGRLFFKGRLARPTDDLEIIRSRQGLVRELTAVAERDRVATLREHLDILRENELQMSSFWNPKGQMLPGRADKYFSRLSEALDKFINQNPTVLTAHACLETLKTAVQTALITAAVAAGPLYILSQTGLFEEGGALQSFLEEYVKRASGSSGPLYLLASLAPSTVVKGLASAISASVAALTAKTTIEWNQVELEFNQMIHRKLLGVASYYRSMKEIYGTLRHTPIAGRLEHFDKLTAFMNNPRLKTLFGALESRTFDGEAGYLYQLGNVLYSWRTLEDKDVKRAFEEAITAMAEIDTVLGTAELSTETLPSGESLYCVPDFIEGAQVPEIRLTDYRHPMVSRERAIPNSIDLGGDAGPRNLVVTGTNAAGKSTNLRSILTAITMAQSLGIAPVTAMSLTPFGRVISSMHTSDSVGDGQSLFQAQIKRADQLISSLRRSSPGVFTLSALDELFNGSNRLDGPAFAYGTAETLGKFPNSMTLFATHFVDNIPQLEGDRWSNYCVPRDPDGTPTYRLEPGVCRSFEGTVVAQQMAFDPETMARVESEKARLEAAHPSA